jgi:hypothetical protein
MLQAMVVDHIMKDFERLLEVALLAIFEQRCDTI